MTNLPRPSRRGRDRRASADEGATAVEYGLIIALIATVITLAVTGLGTQLTAAFSNIKF